MLPHETANTLETLPKVDLSGHAQEGTYAIARVLMDVVYDFLKIFDLQDNSTLFTVLYAALVFVIAWGIGWIVQWSVTFLVTHLGKHIHTPIYGYLRDLKFFTRTFRIIPGIVFLIFIEFTLNGRATLSSWLTRLTWIYIAFIITNSLTLLVDAMWRNINERANKRKLPLSGIAQVIKGAVWILCVIVVVSILIDKSPGSLLAGLGAFAAVLMLVFKDSILGVVAGVQLSENDSLHVGDWIAVGEANGTVTEVSLTAVKVQNWDKTTTTVPPYYLISNGFKNYRTMQQSNTRRIQRSYMIDADSVVPCDQALLDEFSKIPMMKDWIDKKVAQRAAGKEQNAANPAGLADGSIDTNLGVFRAYLKMWLDSNPNIASTGDGNDCFVTTLPQTPYGIPLQVYCFTSTSKWIPYEAIMSTVFEHIAVMLYRFHLYTYESPSGRDTIIDGYICPGKNPDVVFGMPYPFFQNGGSPENPCNPMPSSAFPQPQAMQTASPSDTPAPHSTQAPVAPSAPAAPATPV